MMPFDPNNDDNMEKGILNAHYGIPENLDNSMEEKLIKSMLTKRAVDRANI